MIKNDNTIDILKSLYTGLDRLVYELHALSVPRIEDLPYWTSPPIQFVYESSTDLIMGKYTWEDNPSQLVSDRPLLDNALYFLRNITLSADITELDYQSSLLIAPQFYMFLSGDSKSILFREPIIMNKFLEQFDYRLFWIPRKGHDKLLASFRGSILQTPSLIGKNNITLKAIISAQEIVDDNFINKFVNNSYSG